MKVIETRFDGYIFRSRTEARWAVFFKTAGIRYEYEKEGFDLDGRWYLPDFWLRDVQLWLEVKGGEPTAEERALCKELATASGYGVMLAIGAPDQSENILWFPPVTDSEDEPDPFYGQRFCLADDRKNDGEFCLVADSLGWFSIGPGGDLDHEMYPFVHSLTKDAYEAARAARFERTSGT
jgi:hypothetical protein